MKFFVDSNIFIESLKSNSIAQNILGQILRDYQNLYYINDIVFSEVIYILKYRKNIDIKELLLNFDFFEFAYTDIRIKNKAIEYISIYNLRPNDAFILASCTNHKIQNLISLDSDFKKPCLKNKINLINNIDIYSKLIFTK